MAHPDCSAQPSQMSGPYTCNSPAQSYSAFKSHLPEIVSLVYYRQHVHPAQTPDLRLLVLRHIMQTKSSLKADWLPSIQWAGPMEQSGVKMSCMEGITLRCNG